MIDARGARAFTFNRNAGAFQVDASAAGDWNRSAVSGMTIRMAKGGIRAHGHEFRATNLLFAGGTAPSRPGRPRRLVHRSARRQRERAARDPGRLWRRGGPPPPGQRHPAGLQHALGQLRRRPAAGDLDQAGRAPTPWPCCSRATAPGLINNVLLSRVQVNAPQGGTGITPLAGTNGIKLWNAARIVCLLCDVEVVDVSFEEYSESQGGTAGACANNSYVGCFVHYPGTAAYKDSNGTFTRSVIRTSFFGCDNLGPLPVGNVAGDGGRAQDGDLVAPGFWVCDQYRQPSIQLRSRDKDVLLITSDQKGAAQANADGHPSQGAPYRGLLIEHSSKQSTKITRPVANGALDPDDGTTPLVDVRLELGNGEGDARGELARVQVNDPLYLRPRTTQPVRPLDGLVWYATNQAAVPATGEYWLGTGLYARINSGDAVPVAVTRGAVPERERNVSFTASAADFGKIHRVNNGGEVTVTVPAGLVAAGQGGAPLLGHPPGCRRGALRGLGRGGAARAGQRASPIAKQFQMVEVVDHLGQRRLPARHLPRRRPHPHLGQPPPRAQRQLHGDDRRIWASCTAATTAAPRSRSPCRSACGPPRPTEDVVELTVARVGNAQVFIKADAGTTGTAPMQFRLSATTPGVTQYNRGDGQLHNQYELAPWETRRLVIRKTDATTGELFLDGVR